MTCHFPQWCMAAHACVIFQIAALHGTVKSQAARIAEKDAVKDAVTAEKAKMKETIKELTAQVCRGF